MESIRFRCKRCKRVWHAMPYQASVPCVCHEDCDYCGLLGTATIIIDRQALNPKEEYAPHLLKDLHPWSANRQCTNCGNIQAKPLVDAYPSGDDAKAWTNP